MKFIIFSTFIPASEAICESRELQLQKLYRKDLLRLMGMMQQLEQLIKERLCIPPGHKSVRKLYKAANIEIYGPKFPKRVANSTSPLMSQYMNSKVIDIIANSECFQ